MPGLALPTRIFPIATLVGLSLTVASCDPICTYEYYVANRSDSTIFVRYKAHDLRDTSLVTLRSNSQAQIHSVDVMRKLDGPEGSFLITSFESLEVLRDTAANTRIQKDVQVVSGWEYVGERTGGTRLVPMGTNRYTLTIRNSDY